MLSDAADVLGLAVAVVTTYLGFGIVPAGYALAGALLVAALLLDKSGESGRPDRLHRRKPKVRVPVSDVPLTNGKIDAELVKG